MGASHARLLVQEGAKVVIGDLLDEDGTALAAELGEDNARYVHLDVTSESDWEAAIRAATDRFGGLDILVNNAGMFLGKSSEEATLAEWHKLCGINLTGVFLGTKMALRLTGSNLLDASKDEQFNKFDTLGEQIERDFDEYEIETESAGPVVQMIMRYTF